MISREAMDKGIVKSTQKDAMRRVPCAMSKNKRECKDNSDADNDVDFLIV